MVSVKHVFKIFLMSLRHDGVRHRWLTETDVNHDSANAENGGR